MAISSILICDTFLFGWLFSCCCCCFIYLFYVTTYGLNHSGVLWYNVAKVNTVRKRILLSSILWIKELSAEGK